MSEEKAPLSKVKIFLLIYYFGLILVLTGIGVMNFLGFELINVSMKYLLFGLLIASAAIGGGWWLIKRIAVKWLRITASVVGTVLAMLLIGVLITFFQMILLVQTPLQYTTLTSESGNVAVVMRQLNLNEDRMRLRCEAKGMEYTPDTVTTEEFGYTYTAHPRYAKIFYRMDQPSDGELEIGISSDAQLMYQWLDENTLHLFIENAQPGDEGETTLKLH